STEPVRAIGKKNAAFQSRLQLRCAATPCPAAAHRTGARGHGAWWGRGVSHRKYRAGGLRAPRAAGGGVAARRRTKAAAGACRGWIRVRQGLGRRIWRRSTRRGSPVTRRMAGARLPGRIHSILGSRTERRHGGEGEKKAERRGGAVT
uniref:Uncharacterized protein n=8 Tax=Aegilops tauschii subsp. strangulata TaxID=200361 RepID=A0A453EJP7_AEGTS